ncbi:MAG: TSUP family transporter, partial [Planctomycetes bacterium]|nr:TSUP family transporter [Planctomycetota bacterium]
EEESEGGAVQTPSGQLQTTTRAYTVLYALIAPLSGTMSGMIGMGGPPVILWAMAQPWGVNRTRAFLFVIFMCAIPFQILSLLLAFGVHVWWGVALGLLCSPVVWLGSYVGVFLGNKLNKEQFKVIVYVLLLVLGASSVYKYMQSSF